MFLIGFYPKVLEIAVYIIQIFYISIEFMTISDSNRIKARFAFEYKYLESIDSEAAIGCK